MKYEAFFSRLGFGKLESDIYVALLRKSPLSISDIAREIRAYRGVLYQTLPLLLEKWVISTVKEGKRTLYRAESPEKLRLLYEAEQATFETIISQMERDYMVEWEKPVLRYFEWREELKKIFIDVGQTLPKDGTWYRYSSRKADKSPDVELVKRYKELRDEKKLQRMVITNDSLAKTKRWWLDSEMVSIPASYDLFEDNCAKAIYGNKISFIDWDAMTGFTIESEKLARFEEKIFKLLFKYMRKEKK